MSFTRFRKTEKSKASSVQSNQDYKDNMRQQDNLSQYSRHSQDQYEYQPKPQYQQQQRGSPNNGNDPRMSPQQYQEKKKKGMKKMNFQVFCLI